MDEDDILAQNIDDEDDDEDDDEEEVDLKKLMDKSHKK